MPTLAELEAVARGAPPQRLGDADRERIAAARAVVEAAVDSEAVVYGVTTGFGQLASVSVPRGGRGAPPDQPAALARRGRRSSSG